jgi:hypothetical protein
MRTSKKRCTVAWIQHFFWALFMRQAMISSTAGSTNEQHQCVSPAAQPMPHQAVANQVDQVASCFGVPKTSLDHNNGRIRFAPFGKRCTRILNKSRVYHVHVRTRKTGA